jgi:hypothetical protein
MSRREATAICCSRATIPCRLGAARGRRHALATQRLSGDLELTDVATATLPAAKPAGDLDGDGIRALRATLSDVDYLQRHDGRRMQLELRGAAAQAFVEGRYTAWACLNEA